MIEETVSKRKRERLLKAFTFCLSFSFLSVKVTKLISNHYKFLERETECERGKNQRSIAVALSL